MKIWRMKTMKRWRMMDSTRRSSLLGKMRDVVGNQGRLEAQL